LFPTTNLLCFFFKQITGRWLQVKQRTTGQRGAFLGFLVAIMVIVPALMAAGSEPAPAYKGFGNPPGIAFVNGSIINETALEPFKTTQEPVTIFHSEVVEPALPGPRYMAFGPSVIDISMNPIVLAALIVLVILVIAAWCIRSGLQREDEEDV
jgi:ABC-type antimicrobial peptide transport system permease subunit